ncbi:MAG: S-adenosyl-l-methionine hydroxide adenosyltransferase [Chloroflexota bacterium]|nr:MAG: S-adenosyl-l-methionine hydroxide adenosyltransferase [Chloroflexota bacterium]
MRKIITLTTDFGLRDGYVGTMKAVILSIAPATQIVDITHQVAPQNILQGALALAAAARYFPAGTIHVVVVDPGVGSARRAIGVQTPEATFIGPDNGLLSLVLFDRPGSTPVGKASDAGPFLDATYVTRQRLLSPSCHAVSLDHERVGLPLVGNTFHGRDIFAPAAARVALGTPLSWLGATVSRLAMFALPRPECRPDGTVVGHVIDVDHFGNLITDIESAALPVDGRVEVCGHTIAKISRSYAEGRDLVALLGSSGRLEVAWRNGNAAERLGVGVGAPVMVAPRQTA